MILTSIASCAGINNLRYVNKILVPPEVIVIYNQLFFTKAAKRSETSIAERPV